MFTISTYPSYECTKKCRSYDHAEKIINKAPWHCPSVGDEKIAAFIAKCCRNFAGIADECVRFASVDSARKEFFS